MPASPVAALRTTVALARREKALGLLEFVLHSATLSFLSWREIALLVARVTAAWSGVIPFERTLNVAVWHAVCQAVVREHPFLCIPAKLPHGTICSWEAFFWEQLFPGSPATLTAASKAIARAMEGAGARDGCCARMATEAVAGRALLRRTVAHSERSWKLEEMDMFLCTSAFLANDLSRVQRYLLEGANPNKLCFGDTPVFRAAMLEDEALVSVLLAVGADPNRTSKARVVGGISATPLYAAAQCGNVSITRRLLTAGAKPNLPRGDGATPVMVAAQSGSTAVVGALLRAGASPNAAMVDGSTALIVSAECGHHEVVAELLSNGAACDHVMRDGATALTVASQSGFVTTVNLLLAHGADPNRVLSGDGASATFLAAQNGFERTLGCLLRHGASPSTARLDGVGPLMVAAEFGHVGSVATLLRHGAPVNQATRPDGVTALMAAAESGHCSVTRLLLAAGANPNAAMRNSATPLLFATQGGHAEIEAQLLAAGAVDDDCAADGSGLLRLPLALDQGVEYE